MAVKTGSIFDNKQFQAVAQPIQQSTATPDMPYATKFDQSISDSPQFQAVAQPINVAPQLQAIQQIQQPQLQQPQYQMPNIQAPSKGGYDSMAGDYINPIINNQITQLQNALNSSLTNYENQKTGINQQAGESVVTANQNNQVNKNNYNNETLSRGLGRSTIATTGTAGIDNTNNRILANIEKIRTGTLGNIDAQKTQAQNAFESSKAGLESDRQSMIKSKADELYDKDYAKYMQQVQMAQNASNNKWEQDYKTTQANQSQTNWQSEYEKSVNDTSFNQKLAKDKQALDAIDTMAKINGTGAYAKTASSAATTKAALTDATNKTWLMYNNMDPYSANEWLNNSDIAKTIISTLGNDEYNSLVSNNRNKLSDLDKVNQKVMKDLGIDYDISDNTSNMNKYLGSNKYSYSGR